MVSERDETRSRFDEWLSGETGGFGVEHGLVQLPVREAPLPVLPPTSEWVNADLFAEKGEGFDYSLAIQRAIDSGARVVYIPAGGAVKSTIEIRGNLEWIMGFGNLLWWSGPQNEKERFPLFRVGPGARRWLSLTMWGPTSIPNSDFLMSQEFALAHFGEFQERVYRSRIPVSGCWKFS